MPDFLPMHPRSLKDVKARREADLAGEPFEVFDELKQLLFFLRTRHRANPRPSRRAVKQLRRLMIPTRQMQHEPYHMAVWGVGTGSEGESTISYSAPRMSGSVSLRMLNGVCWLRAQRKGLPLQRIDLGLQLGDALTLPHNGCDDDAKSAFASCGHAAALALGRNVPNSQLMSVAAHLANSSLDRGTKRPAIFLQALIYEHRSHHSSATCRPVGSTAAGSGWCWRER